MNNEYIVCGKYSIIFLQEVDGEKIETSIDTEDLQMLVDSNLSWKAHWNPKTKSYYAISSNKHTKNNPAIFMHRFLTNCPFGFVVDHINHDSLDNRRKYNLRVVTQSENLQNRRLNSNNKSGFIGVSWDRRKSKWNAQITVNGKVHRLGVFDDVNKANQAVLNAKLTRHPFQKKDARQNEGLERH